MSRMESASVSERMDLLVRKEEMIVQVPLRVLRLNPSCGGGGHWNGVLSIHRGHYRRMSFKVVFVQ